MAEEYEQSLADTRREARSVIENAQAEAQQIAAEKQAAAQQEAAISARSGTKRN